MSGERRRGLARAPAEDAALPIPDAAVTVLDDSGMAGSYPGCVTPLTQSFALRMRSSAWRTVLRAAGVPETGIAAHAELFEALIGRVDGRLYDNLISWYRALALLPGFAATRGTMDAVLGLDRPLPPEIVAAIGARRPGRGLAGLVDRARLVRPGLRLLGRALLLRRTVAAFRARIDAALVHHADELQSMPLSALAHEYRRIEADLIERWDAPPLNAVLCVIGVSASRRLLGRWAGAAGLARHQEILLGRDGGLAAEPARRIRRMAAMAAGDAVLIARLAAGDRAAPARHPGLAREIAAYLARFADRCPAELKLESVPLDEDPRPLLAAIAAAARRPAPDPANGVAGLRALFAGRPLRRLLAAGLMAWVKARLDEREILRWEHARLVGRIRKLVLAIGGQLHAHGLIAGPRDVLFLTLSEIMGAIRGSGATADLRGLVAVRRADMAAASARPDPPRRLIVRGAVAGGSMPPTLGLAAAPAGPERIGQPGSPGLVRGRARLAGERGEALQPGEILVARHADPGWLAAFATASAVVAERGGPFSPTAMAARAFGIPCVLGLEGATQWLRSGDMLEVDGAAGLVRKLQG